MNWGPMSEAEVLGKPSVPVGKGKKDGVEYSVPGEKEKCMCISQNVLEWGRGERPNPSDSAQQYSPQTRPHFKKWHSTGLSNLKQQTV